jgi:hypothetical protein
VKQKLKNEASSFSGCYAMLSDELSALRGIMPPLSGSNSPRQVATLENMHILCM